ncbi:butyrophilin subfamily 1 member A1-like [Archocentrus centrarchus]|uniref:butyrophilin subfamily 1 member A1-like n=1 Tax=Archocentrus centrarchus TaxID=63155 RepID=UPI0011EA1283|nr:butyrophilin subfamily 1 member A1-like [Archocentrus centrarchus]
MREFIKVCVFFHLHFLLTCGSATLVCLIVLAVGIPSCTGKDSAIILPKIVAFVGETVLLPCNTTPTGDVPTVEWIKEGLFPDIAFLYRDGCETFEMKNLVFQYRTKLIRHELHSGNLSMLISNVQPKDRGTYQCVTRRNNKKQIISRLELVVGAVSEPRLSVVPGVGDELTLQCEARCWFPEPLIIFLDNQGNEMSAEDPRRKEDSPGCLTATRKVTLQTPTNRVTCRVHQPELNQTRYSEIWIPDACLRSCTVIVVICIVAMTSVVPVFFLIFLLAKKYCCTGEKQKSPVKDETIEEQTNENNERKPSTATMPPSESSNDSTSSLGISNIFPQTAESPHSNHNNNPKPEATSTSCPSIANSLSETTEEDLGPHSSTRTPAPDPVMKSSSQDSSSAFSINSNTLSIPSTHSKDVLNVTNKHRTSSVRSQRRSNNSQESEPLIG